MTNSIIYAFRTGGLPLYVMPLVFGGAPIVNVLVSLAIHPPKSAINPMLSASDRIWAISVSP